MGADEQWRWAVDVKRYVVKPEMYEARSVTFKFLRSFVAFFLSWVFLQTVVFPLTDRGWPPRHSVPNILLTGFVFAAVVALFTSRVSRFDFFIYVGKDFLATRGSLGSRTMNRTVQRNDVHRIYKKTIHPGGLLGTAIPGLAVEDGRSFVFLPICTPGYSEIAEKISDWTPTK